MHIQTHTHGGPRSMSQLKDLCESAQNDSGKIWTQVQNLAHNARILIVTALSHAHLLDSEGECSHFLLLPHLVINILRYNGNVFVFTQSV